MQPRSQSWEHSFPSTETQKQADVFNPQQEYLFFLRGKELEVHKQVKILLEE